MTLFFQLDDALHAQLKNQQLVLTPNRRMALHIRAASNKRQTTAAWPVPKLFAIDDWIQAHWQQLQDRGSTRTAWFLSAQQEQALWQDIIGNDNNMQQTLLPVRQLAKQAASSYRLLQRWQLSAHSLSDKKSADASPAALALQRWIAQFQQRCKQLNTISSSDIASELLHAWRDELLPREADMVLCGFHDIPPLYDALVKTAAINLTAINPVTGTAAQQQHIALPDSSTEITAFAQWARDILRTHPDGDLQIALVVPDLASKRPQVERQLMQVLESHYALPAFAASATPINFSAGVPLASTPLIFSALELLALLQYQWPLQRLLYLLHSPFWGHWPDDLQTRTAAEKIWRAQHAFDLTQTQAIALLRHDAATTPLADRLQQLALQKSTTHCAPSQWRMIFAKTLSDLDWPGERRLNSLEYQQAEHWQQCLQELASLDAVINPCDLNTALQWLRDICAAHNFQAQSQASPIQVLGVLEASGLHFTHLWLSGMSRNAWPPAPAPDPLLPLPLQRQHNMPHASSEREYAYASHVSALFANCTQHLVCSHAEREGDCEQNVSALWSHLPSFSAEKYLPNNIALDVPALENVDISHAPAVGAHENIRGGFSILRTHIINPFNAFAKYRLGVDVADEPTLGVTAIERGNLVHTVLEHFWRHTMSSQALHAMDSDTQYTLLNTLTDSAIAKILQKKSALQQALALEKIRLLRLLDAWLAKERTRAAFTVTGLEEKIDQTLAGLNLQLRIDRIDQLENGHYVLMDYKTGATALKRTDWVNTDENDPPLEPQLPLYAAFYAQTDGIVWAQIHTKKMAFTGFGNNEDIPGLFTKKDNWQQSAADWRTQQLNWKKSLERVAADFMQGNTSVTLGGSPERAWLALNRIPEAEDIVFDDESST